MASKPLVAVGSYMIFLSTAMRLTVFPFVDRTLLFKHMEFVGNRSIGVVLLASIGIGSVFGLQFSDIFRIFGAEGLVGAAAGYALAKELAPVITAFIVTARAGSAMAAEIATMKVNEQIEAMRVMAVNPYGYLVAPRILASVLMMPLLSAIFLLSGVVSSFVICTTLFNVDVGVFVEKIVWIIRPLHVIQGLEKAIAFGLVFSSIGCFRGLNAERGAKGVGKAVTSAVVISLVSILVTDFVISFIQLSASGL